MTDTVLAPTASTTRWNLDPAHTLVEFSAKHMMITTVKGRLEGVAGEVVVDEANPAASKAQATLDVATINTGVGQRDDHLRSADFLDAANFPQITFESTRVEGLALSAGDEFKLVGDLTIHGVTREVTLDAVYEGRGTDPWGGERVSFSVKGRIDRRDFGLTWNQALETGGILVSNEIRISAEVQAVRA
jgi:polyisoprenoid-binding protein YceI